MDEEQRARHQIGPVVKGLYVISLAGLVIGTVLKWSGLARALPQTVRYLADAVVVLPAVALAAFLLLQLTPSARPPAPTPDRAFPDAWFGMFVVLLLTRILDLHRLASPGLQVSEDTVPYFLFMIGLGLIVRVAQLAYWRVHAQPSSDARR
jgi:hypothetical protein